MNTASCQGNYSQLCQSSGGNFTPITNRETGTDRCCRFPRMISRRQRYWVSEAEGTFKRVVEKLYLCEKNLLVMDQFGCQRELLNNGCNGFPCNPHVYAYELKIDPTHLQPPWLGKRVNITRPGGGSSIHVITSEENNEVQLTPKVTPEDMGKTPMLWNYSVMGKSFVDEPMETSFGEHLMCHDDSDCLGVRNQLVDPASGMDLAPSVLRCFMRAQLAATKSNSQLLTRSN